MELPLLTLICCGLAVASTNANSNEWSGEGELGFTSTSGNTDNDSLSARLGIGTTVEQWTHTAGVSVFKASDKGVDSADSGRLNVRSAYKFSQDAYGFAALRYEQDKFSGFDYQTSLVFGAGKQIINNAQHELDLSAGLGYRNIKEMATGTTESGGVVSTNLNYLYRISEHASLQEELGVESGDSNTRLQSVTSLKMKIAGNLDSKISYIYINNSDVPAGINETDTVTSVTMVYSF